MNPIKPALVVLLLSASLLAAVQAQATILPDSCGKDEIKFKVKVKKPTESQPNPAPTPLEAGKARIVFIEMADMFSSHQETPSTRFGVDGYWVGANKGDSYFIVDVTPGEHHVCANWQSESDSQNKQVGMDTFTAEAGKTYYYQAKIRENQGAIGQYIWSKIAWTFDLTALNKDDGQYRVKALALSTFKTFTPNM